MSQLKFFILSLILFVSVSIYGGFYLSSILNSGFENINPTEELIASEMDLIDTYQLFIFEEQEAETGEVLKAASIEDMTSLRVLKTIPNSTDHTIDVDEVITVIFSEFVRLEDLLGYIEKLGNQNICPSGKHAITATDKLIRCGELNKIFLNKAGEKDQVFEGTAKRSNVNNRAIMFIPDEPLDGLSEYVLKIASGLEGFSKSLDVNVKLNEDKIVAFDTLQGADFEKNEFLNSLTEDELGGPGSQTKSLISDQVDAMTGEVSGSGVLSDIGGPEDYMDSSTGAEKSLLENVDDENIIEILDLTGSDLQSNSGDQLTESASLSGSALESVTVQSGSETL